MNERRRELDDAQCAAAVGTDFKREPKDLLFEIYKEATNGAQDPDARIAKTIAKFCALLVKLSAQHEKIHRSIRWLTIWIVVLTIVLSVLTAYLCIESYQSH